jgi:exo-1,4-beta-D-glucosaminidase
MFPLHFGLCASLFLAFATLTAHGATLPLDRNWQLQSSYVAKEDGATLSSDSFTPQNWYPAQVPCTVLTALVKADVYPDPYVGMNNMKIPDAWEPFNELYGLSRYSHLPNQRNPWKDPYWFWTRFDYAQAVTPGQTVWLHLGAINYRADVWLNGHQVARADDLVGMFADWRLPITPFLRTNRPNTLAVKIYPPDDPADPGPAQMEAFGDFGVNGGPTGDIGKNVTMQCAVGWDWLPAIRDRNMGLWQPVSLETTGQIEIRPPHVITTLSQDGEDASLTVKVDLRNLTPIIQRGTCMVRITPPTAGGDALDLSCPVMLDPFETQTVVFDPQTHASLLLKDPQLWWPNGYGPQALYTCDIRFNIQDTTVDQTQCRFGVRTVDSRVTMVDGWARRDFFVNGHKILLQGGAWVPDMMLNRSPEKCRYELRLFKEANLNIVRIWGGGVTPQDTFFDTCDELGLLVWHDFWITGDCQGTWGKGSKDYPYDEEVFLRHARRVVEKYRHHPSVLVWTAGNEGYPRAEIYLPLRDQLVAELDGSRPFIPSSGFKEPPGHWGLSWPDNGPAGTYSGGPYCWVDPCEYYRLVDAGKDWVFKNEVGIPSVPTLESLRKFIPDLTPKQGVLHPLNHTWGYHDACEGNGKYSLYDQALRRRYGEPRDVEDYVNKAQLINAESYRAMFEAVNHASDRTAGVILWKANPAWPSVIWQLYDWYLCPNAGYYYTQKACEPVHVQMNVDDRSLTAINRTRERQDLVLEGKAYAADMECVWTIETGIRMEPGTAREIGQVEIPARYRDQICFVSLQLLDKDRNSVSDNFYWIANHSDFTALADLDRVTLKATARQVRTDREEPTIHVQLENASDTLAFFVHLSICETSLGQEILPSFWQDNYINLLPGQTRDVSVTVPRQPRDKTLYLKVEGNNLISQAIKIP